MPKDGSINRERILDAAQRLVIETGFAATSLDQVLKQVGTSKGAFFHHFDSKLDLGRALTERYAAADIGQLRWALQETADIDDPGELMSAQSNCLYVAVLTEQQLVSNGTADFVTFEGAFLLSRSTGDPDHMRAQLGVLRRLLGAVLGLPAST